MAKGTNKVIWFSGIAVAVCAIGLGGQTVRAADVAAVEAPVQVSAPAEAEKPREVLAAELAVSWRAFHECLQADRKTPLERIAAVDQWRREHESQTQALAARRVAAAPPAVRPHAPAAPTSERKAIQAAIEQKLQPIRAARLPALERIRQMDLALKRVSALLESLRRLDRETPISSETGYRLETPVGSGPEGDTLESRIALKTRQILTQTRGISPVERIAAIDAWRSEMDALSRRASSPAAPSTVQSIPSTPAAQSGESQNP